MGVRGWIAALDAKTGRERWRAYNLGPDSDVKIGPRFQPFYQTERGHDLAATSWPAGAWQHGGAAVWGWLTYDPDAQSAVLRHQQSWPMDRRHAARGQQVHELDPRARPGYG